MPNEEWGTKRLCPTTGKRFYDLNKNPIISPYTGEVVEVDQSKSRMIAADAEDAATAKAKKAEVVADDEDLVDDDDVDVDLDALARGKTAPIAEAFHAEHRRLYGHADPDAPIQVIAVSMIVIGQSPKPVLPREEVRDRDAEPSGRMEAWIDGARRDVALFARRDLGAGARFAGPCVIQQDDTTTVVPPGFTGRVDAHGNLILSVEGTHAH